jgi:non-homologous end joining protein Ku
MQTIWNEGKIPKSEELRIPSSNVVKLMDALQASIQATKPKTKTRSKTTRKPTGLKKV